MEPVREIPGGAFVGEAWGEPVLWFAGIPIRKFRTEFGPTFDAKSRRDQYCGGRSGRGGHAGARFSQDPIKRCVFYVLVIVISSGILNLTK